MGRFVGQGAEESPREKGQRGRDEGIAKHGVYKKVPISRAWDETGKAPIAVRWVDINKGDDVNANYRSRLVAKEIKKHDAWSLFAATPPWESVKLLLSMAVTKGIGYVDNERKGMKIEILDVRRAYFYAAPKRKVYVKLPEEDDVPGMCGELLKSMYGTRDVANNWEQEYTEFLKSIGFVQGDAVTCAFKHLEKSINLVVHGDDFTALGHAKDLDWLKKNMREKFEVKATRIGPDVDDDKSAKLLNRIIEWTANGITVEGDQRHSERVARSAGIDCKSKHVVTPYDVADKGDDDIALTPELATQYRANVARGNFMCSDRSDIQYTVKELSRHMANPRRCDLGRLKRLARYLAGRPRIKVQYLYQTEEEGNQITVYSDTDFAGCRETRKSTSGGVLMIGKHLIKTWSSTQSVIAMSSGEAEYYGMVKAAAQALGISSMIADLTDKKETSIELKSDASAAIGIACRRGMGKVRHIEVNQLWLQEKVVKGRIIITTIGTYSNLADQLTKPVTAEKMQYHFDNTHQKVTAGRHPMAPSVAK